MNRKSYKEGGGGGIARQHNFVASTRDEAEPRVCVTNDYLQQIPERAEHASLVVQSEQLQGGPWRSRSRRTTAVSA